MKRFYFLITITLIVMVKSTYTQNYTSLTDEDFAKFPYWIEMMSDESVNFFDVQRAFELYWNDREVTKGSGWKPFKRWEYMTSSRVYPDGTRFPADLNWIEYHVYKDKFPENRYYSGNWENLGPFLIPGSKGYNGLGRVNSIAFHPTDPNTIYLGAPAGGLWVTHDKGETWYSETDVLPTLGVSSIVVDHAEPSVIYIGSGDRDAGDAPGMGVMKSVDGGMTWQLSNNGMGNRIVGRMIMHPQDNQVIIAATNSGICKTTDGGHSWQVRQGGDFKEVVFKPNDPSVIYASANGRFYRSTDTGETFQLISSGLPVGARGVIGVSPANPEIVYFLLTTGDSFLGLYRSDDAGLSFSERSTTPNIMSWGCAGGDGGQAWYDLDMAVDPLNENILFAGGVNCFKSSDGGITWQISSHWWGDCGVPAVHADLHILEYSPLDGRLYAGNDGGIYWTGNGGTNWTEISNGLAISQVYKIGQSATVSNKVINGYQDNGTATYTGTQNWIPTIGGDGMECAVDHQNAVYSYGTLYFGDIFRMTNNVNAFKVAGNNSFGITEDGGWVTPFLLHKGDANKMFVGYKNIWRGFNIRSNNPTWQKISNNLAGSNNVNMRAIEQSPVNYEILYAAREDRKLFRTDNANKQSPTWTDLSTFLPDNNHINDLEAHPFDENIVYMAKGTKVFKSVDKGISWTNISGSLPSVSVNSLAYHKNSHEGLYAGTDIGIFYKDAFMDDWMLYGDGFPASSRVTEVEIFHDASNPENDRIRASTYGRGLWESDMYYDSPVADLVADHTIITPFCAVNFTDSSLGVPTSWNWEFEGAIPATSTVKNPPGIVYETPGTYKVTLTVTNKAGSNQVVKEDYITVSDQLLPAPDFSVNQSAFCSWSALTITDLSLYCPTTYEWSFYPDNVVYIEGTSSTSPNPMVMFSETGSYSVTLIVHNYNGSASLTKENYIHYGGFPTPFIESFEEGFASKSWSVENPDSRKTWQVIAPDFTPHGQNAAFMNHFDYYFMFERDRLISPIINLKGVTEAHLSFKHAYAQRYSQVDSLLVKISTNCGNSWQTIYVNGPDGFGGFETSPPTAAYFNPASGEDWCGEGYGADCISIDISPFCNQPDVRIMFEAFNRIGNNLYIDDVEISVLTKVDRQDLHTGNFRMYPNPSDGMVQLIFEHLDDDVHISVFDINGKEIHRQQKGQTEAGETISLDLSMLDPGVYFVKVNGNNQTAVNLLILQ
ncbi:MAG: PKD domain-containing protein [Bacteroidales bacterium]|nr:PKD domain-containing protein [Bacteroidales bacterium]